MLTTMDKVALALERVRVLRTIRSQVEPGSYQLAAYRLARRVYPDLTGDEWRGVTNLEPPEPDEDGSERTCECPECADESCQADCAACDDHGCPQCGCSGSWKSCCGVCDECDEHEDGRGQCDDVCDMGHCHECDHRCDS